MSTASGRLAGKVALVTGAARGQGRSHALRLAEEGADVVAIDACAPIDSVPYAMPVPEDLAATARDVEAHGRRAVACRADVRDVAELRAAIDGAVAELGGRLDIVVANAGIGNFGSAEGTSAEAWRDMLDINLTGVWHTVVAALPHLRASGTGGAVVVTSSVVGISAQPGIAAYVASKHGVVGLMQALALELGPERIRVNSVHPTQVDTPMIMNDLTRGLFVPGEAAPTQEQFAAASQATHALPVPWLEPVDVSNAVVFLASDEARYITGVSLPIDAGALVK